MFGRRRAEIAGRGSAGALLIIVAIVTASARIGDRAGATAEGAGLDMHSVVSANDLIGNVDAGGAPQDRALLHHHRVAVLLAQIANDFGEVMHDLLGKFIVLALELVFGVLEVALEIFCLAEVIILETLALLRLHQHAFLFELVLEVLDVGFLALKFSLFALNAVAELGLGGLARFAFVQRALDIDIGKFVIG